MSLAPDLAAIVQVGTTVTCDVETKAARRYTRSGTVIRSRCLRDGMPRALCSIEEYRAGRAHDERNTFALLPNGSWGVRLHTSASRSARPGETREVAVTARSGRVSHVRAKITGIVENKHGDHQAVAEILSRDRGGDPAFEADHGVTAACPSCGTMACDLAGESQPMGPPFPIAAADLTDATVQAATVSSVAATPFDNDQSTPPR